MCCFLIAKRIILRHFKNQPMAIINKMRKQGWVFIVILGTLALFVMSDLISGFQKGGGMEDPIVGEINGVSIKYSEYDLSLRNRLGMKEQNKQGAPLDENDRQGAAGDAWDDLFRKYVVYDEYEKLGIVASNEELKTQLFTDDAHPFVRQYFTNDKGEFSSANVRNWYAQVYKSNPEAQVFFNSLKDAIVSSIQSEKYRDLIEKGIHVTNFDILQDFIGQTRMVSGSVVGLQLSSVNEEDVKYDENDLKNYYNANKNEFKLNEERDIEYVSWSVIPSNYDSLDVLQAITNDITLFANADNDSAFAAVNSERPFVTNFRRIGDFAQELNGLVVNAMKGDVVGPVVSTGSYVIAKVADVRETQETKYKYKQMIIPRNWNDKQDSIEKAKDARAFFDRMKTEGWDAVLPSAREIGYQVYGDIDGNMPWANDDMLDPSIMNEIKRGKKGDYIFKFGEQGYYLLYVDETPNNMEYVVVEIYKEITPSTKTANESYVLANQLRAQLSNGAKGKFDEILESNGYAKRIAKELTRSGATVPGIDDAKEIIRWAFDDERKLNDISDVFTLENRQVVAHLSGVRKEGIGSFEEVREKVVEAVIKQKKFELLELKLAEARKDKSNLIQIALALGTVAQDFSRVNFKSEAFYAARDEARIHGAALGMPLNKISTTIRGENGVYIVNVTEETTPEIPTDLENRKGMVHATLFQTLETKVVSSLKSLADIKDYRTKYY
jgi:peptidyl-prolyl cis-trans isomerase D